MKKLINNYNFERIDYITNQFLLNNFTKLNNISNLIEHKHFNNKYPENNNIKGYFKYNECFVYENNKWNIISKNILMNDLIFKNCNFLLNFYINNKDIIIDDNNKQYFDIYYNILLNFNNKTYNNNYFKFYIDKMITKNSFNL